MGQRVAVVTGASRGIGYAIANRLTVAGYRVIKVQRTGADVSADLSMWESASDVWMRISELAICGVDLLVLNAGSGADSDFLQLTSSEILARVNLNLLGPLALMQQALCGWHRDRAAGHVVVVGSQAALPGTRQADVIYAATKAALHAVIGPIASAYGPLVRINCVAPGDVSTEVEVAAARANARASDVDPIGTIARRSPLGRWVTPDEIAEAVLFLHTCQAMNGCILNVSAGTSIH